MEKIGITIRELLRYGYGGFMLYAFSTLACPVEVSGILKVLDLGPVVTNPVLAALGGILVGAGFYAVHRALLNDPILDPLEYWIHRGIERMRTSSARDAVGRDCVRHHLEERIGVARRNSRDAFRVIRDSDLFAPHVRDRFHIQNTEIHLLFLTATAALLALFLRGVSEQCYTWRDAVYPRSLFLWAAVIFFLAGLIATIRLCRQECAYLRALDSRRMRERLQEPIAAQRG